MEFISDHELLDVISFVKAFKYDIDKLYIDKFWNNINDSKWLIIDNSMLKWMGYNNNRDRDNKRTYLRLLDRNFIKSEEYDIISGTDIRICVHMDAPKNTIIVSPNIFKECLMLISTEKARIIRHYYLLIEKIFIDYMKYSNVVIQHNLELEANKYKSKLAEMESTQSVMESLRINTKPLEYSEYVYILTTKRYYNLNLFKIGKTINLSHRLISYNTGAVLDDDQCFYVCSIKTSDSRSLEKQLHLMLQNFHYHKEWYRISQIDILSIIKFVSNQQEQLKSHIDTIIQNQLQEKKQLSLDEFINLSKPKIENGDGYYELDDKFFCCKCDKDYKSLIRIQTHLEKDACRESKVGDYKCPKCSKSFVVKHYFDKHCNEDNCGTKTLLSCNNCSKTYTSQLCYQKHVTNGCNLIICKRCGKLCKSRSELHNHMNRKVPCVGVENVQ